MELLLLSATLLFSVSATPSPEQRAAALVANMTLSEQIALLHGAGWGQNDYVGKVFWSVNNTDMHIPPINLNDGPQGFRCNGLGKCPAGTSTQYPSGLTVAATWSPASAQLWGEAMGKEFYAKGANVQLGPGLNIARVPRNGRNFEYMSGEDPILGQLMVPGAICGIQSQGVVANAKHFVLNNQESNRQLVDVYVDERTLHQVYLPPFEAAIDAGVGSFMCSYNRVGGQWSCQHNATLNTALRDQLGFQGWVMSDWRATHSTSIEDGLDQEMPGSVFMNNLTLSKHKASVRRSALRILTPLFRAGVFDTNNTNPISANASTPERMATARELSENSTVLLQNNNSLLPLRIRTRKNPSGAVTRIVLVGQDAVEPTTGGGGSGLVNPSYLPAPLSAIQNYVAQAGGARVSNCSQASFEEGVDYYQPGWMPPSAPGADAADCCAQCASMGDQCRYFSFQKSKKKCWFKTTRAGWRRDSDVTSGGCFDSTVGTDVLHFANAADAAPSLGGDGTVAIVFVSQSSQEGLDRFGLGYPEAQNQMVSSVASLCNRTVVVAVAPGAVLLPWAAAVSAILVPFLPGQMFGEALARLVFGEVSPSGRLPVTFPNKENEMEWTASQWPGVGFKVNYSEKLLVGYRWYDAHGVRPAFPFGHGLTYSSFSYGSLTLKPGEGDVRVAVSSELTNTGQVCAEEVVQLYLHFPPEAGEPVKVLKGFSKTRVGPRETVLVSFALRARDLSVWDVSAHGWAEVKGAFLVSVGASAGELHSHATFDNK